MTAFGDIDWAPLVDSMRGEIDGGFLMRWIRKESDGNPCSKGAWDGPWEAGIGQVYFDKNERNAVKFGVTLDQLRECCYIGSELMASPVTDVQMQANVKSLVGMASAYMSIAMGKLYALSENWSKSDVQCLAKLYHALPILVTTHLSIASQDGMASDWDSYRAYLGQMDRDGILSIDQRAGYPPGKGAAPYWPLDRLFDNAQFTGRG